MKQPLFNSYLLHMNLSIDPKKKENEKFKDTNKNRKRTGKVFSSCHMTSKQTKSKSCV